jgi:putative redox protein
MGFAPRCAARGGAAIWRDLIDGRDGMKARVTWVEDRTFVGEAGTGHKVAFGTAHGEGGQKPGPSPMELVLIGTGGCSAYDVVSILEKGREAVEDVAVTLEADRAETDPKVFVRIHMHFTVKGRGLSVKKVERAISLSVDKYCSASAMMAKTAVVTHGFEVVDTA